MLKPLVFNSENQLELTSEEFLEIIDTQDKVTFILENGFTKDSDTEDVFRGIYGDIGFEENEDMMNGLELQLEVRHTFFISNAKTESPFNERGMVKRLIRDNFWTRVLLHDQPLKDGCYAVIVNKECVKE